MATKRRKASPAATAAGNSLGPRISDYQTLTFEAIREILSRRQAGNAIGEATTGRTEERPPHPGEPPAYPSWPSEIGLLSPDLASHHAAHQMQVQQYEKEMRAYQKRAKKWQQWIDARHAELDSAGALDETRSLYRRLMDLARNGDESAMRMLMHRLAKRLEREAPSGEAGEEGRFYAEAIRKLVDTDSRLAAPTVMPPALLIARIMLAEGVSMNKAIERLIAANPNGPKRTFYTEAWKRDGERAKRVARELEAAQKADDEREDLRSLAPSLSKLFHRPQK